ncbi:unnamed protein product [Wuchereria bancrofti]|uniref:Uncharacterized protein n=1 Tax=Wuchereria bancrofti TaxID=6293 RepID=A0A3P7DR75_WUCBA|nr:unnamed protein product [Wuchereria bancrofti]
MRDKGHCRVAHSVEEMIEFEDFYDYSTIYPKEEYIDKSYPIVLVDDGYTLTLPSGAEIGHRSLLRYYRQHLKPVEYGSRSDRQRKEILKKVMIGQYKELGWKGTSGTLAVQRAKDVRYMKKINSKNWMKLGLNNNRQVLKFRIQSELLGIQSEESWCAWLTEVLLFQSSPRYVDAVVERWRRCSKGIIGCWSSQLTARTFVTTF